jgi:WhiB family redox-sensing transcriptional regulator
VSGAEQQLAAEVEVRSWVLRANCVGIDAELFFPDRGEPTRHAKAVCAGCEVRAECLDYALETGQKFGVWGGTSERERRSLRRIRRSGSD